MNNIVDKKEFFKRLMIQNLLAEFGSIEIFSKEYPMLFVSQQDPLDLLLKQTEEDK